MLKEFKDFLLRGNLIALGVAFVIGTAFAMLMTAFVEDLILPIVSAVFGKQQVFDLKFTINNSQFLYGAFIAEAIIFITTVAAVFFFVVKPVDAIDKRRAKGEEPAEPSDEERRHQELLAAVRALKV